MPLVRMPLNKILHIYSQVNIRWFEGHGEKKATSKTTGSNTEFSMYLLDTLLGKGSSNWVVSSLPRYAVYRYLQKLVWESHLLISNPMSPTVCIVNLSHCQCLHPLLSLTGRDRAVLSYIGIYSSWPSALCNILRKYLLINYHKKIS